MQLAKIQVNNFRAHTDTTLPLTRFGCIIGENNAGKSTLLHAIQFALEGGKLTSDDFREKDSAVEVALTIDKIREGDLQRVAEAHRDSVRAMIKDDSLTLIRRQEPNSTSEVRYMAWVPSDPMWSLDTFGDAIKNLRGANLRSAAVRSVPALDEVLDTTPKSSDVKDAFQALIDGLPAEQLVPAPQVIKTGIWQAIKPLLPEVIYIEAVKDASVEARSSGTATFAKLLGLLLAEVEDQFEDITKEFLKVQKKLSRILADDGTLVDERLDAVRAIESTIQQFVRESFPDVELTMNVPAPALSTILGGAELRVNDGHDGLLVSKGDGLKRTVLFAILRAYTALRSGGLSKPDSSTPAHPCVLLFEEPELFLHPRAQRQLMSTLATFALAHQVLVTTHSAGFFGPSTDGFAKLTKTGTGVEALPVDLQLADRDAYQMVQYENNEAAFFAKTVVLVEGDSDTFTFPHLAGLLNPAWNHDEHNVSFIKTGGKGSISRYRSFFGQFGVQVRVITDLDSLSDGFNHLTDSVTLREQHARLMDDVSKHLPAVNAVKSDKVKEIVKKRNSAQLWVAAQEQFEEWKADRDHDAVAALQETLTELFAQGESRSKTDILRTPPAEQIANKRDVLISALANEGVFVLRRGDLEAYCAQPAVNGDKVSSAMTFCREVTTRHDFESRHGVDAAGVVGDLESIFAGIFP